MMGPAFTLDSSTEECHKILRRMGQCWSQFHCRTVSSSPSLIHSNSVCRTGDVWSCGFDAASSRRAEQGQEETFTGFIGSAANFSRTTQGWSEESSKWWKAIANRQAVSCNSDMSKESSVSMLLPCKGSVKERIPTGSGLSKVGGLFPWCPDYCTRRPSHRWPQQWPKRSLKTRGYVSTTGQIERKLELWSTFEIRTTKTHSALSWYVYDIHPVDLELLQLSDRLSGSRGESVEFQLPQQQQYRSGCQRMYFR